MDLRRATTMANNQGATSAGRILLEGRYGQRRSPITPQMLIVRMANAGVNLRVRSDIMPHCSIFG